MSDILAGIGILLLVVLLVVLTLILIGVVFTYILYVNNTAFESVYLDGELVYSGMSRNVSWSQLGEVGNKYYVIEYKVGFWNRFWGRKINYWAGNDLKVENK